MKVTYKEVDLVQERCAACELALGLSLQQVGYLFQDGTKKVWHLACAPGFIRVAYEADHGVVSDG